MNRQFPALSGLAMILIVLNHTIAMGKTILQQVGYPPPAEGVRILLSLLQGLGVFAVPIFLFISGTFVAYAARGKPPRLSAKFVRNSLSHILWPYLLWSLVFYLVIFLQFGVRYSLAGYGKNLLVGYPFHFVPLLVFCYLLSPLLVRLAERHSGLMIAAIAVFQLLLINAVTPGTLGFAYPLESQSLIPPVLGKTLADWAIYFPLGLVYGLHAQSLRQPLVRLRWVLAGAAGLLFVLGALHWNRLIVFPLGSLLCPLPFVLLMPAIERDNIPLVRSLEGIGRRSYGLYLTHLVVLDLSLLIIQTLVPGLLAYYLLLLPLLFVVALKVPMMTMNGLARSPARMRTKYRYVFG